MSGPRIRVKWRNTTEPVVILKSEDKITKQRLIRETGCTWQQWREYYKRSKEGKQLDVQVEGNSKTDDLSSTMQYTPEKETPSKPPEPTTSLMKVLTSTSASTNVGRKTKEEETLGARKDEQLTGHSSEHSSNLSKGSNLKRKRSNYLNQPSVKKVKKGKTRDLMLMLFGSDSDSEGESATTKSNTPSSREEITRQPTINCNKSDPSQAVREEMPPEERGTVRILTDKCQKENSKSPVKPSCEGSLDNHPKEGLDSVSPRTGDKDTNKTCTENSCDVSSKPHKDKLPLQVTASSGVNGGKLTKLCEKSRERNSGKKENLCPSESIKVPVSTETRPNSLLTPATLVFGQQTYNSVKVGVRSKENQYNRPRPEMPTSDAPKTSVVDVSLAVKDSTSQLVLQSRRNSQGNAPTSSDDETNCTSVPSKKCNENDNNNNNELESPSEPSSNKGACFISESNSSDSRIDPNFNAEKVESNYFVDRRGETNFNVEKLKCGENTVAAVSLKELNTVENNAHQVDISEHEPLNIVENSDNIAEVENEEINIVEIYDNADGVPENIQSSTGNADVSNCQRFQIKIRNPDEINSPFETCLLEHVTDEQIIRFFEEDYAAWNNDSNYNHALIQTVKQNANTYFNSQSDRITRANGQIMLSQIQTHNLVCKHLNRIFTSVRDHHQFALFPLMFFLSLLDRWILVAGERAKLNPPLLQNDTTAMCLRASLHLSLRKHNITDVRTLEKLKRIIGNSSFLLICNRIWNVVTVGRREKNESTIQSVLGEITASQNISNDTDTSNVDTSRLSRSDHADDGMSKATRVNCNEVENSWLASNSSNVSCGVLLNQLRAQAAKADKPPHKVIQKVTNLNDVHSTSNILEKSPTDSLKTTVPEAHTKPNTLHRSSSAKVSNFSNAPVQDENAIILKRLLANQNVIVQPCQTSTKPSSRTSLQLPQLQSAKGLNSNEAAMPSSSAVAVEIAFNQRCPVGNVANEKALQSSHYPTVPKQTTRKPRKVQERKKSSEALIFPFVESGATISSNRPQLTQSMSHHIGTSGNHSNFALSSTNPCIQQMSSVATSAVCDPIDKTRRGLQPNVSGMQNYNSFAQPIIPNGSCEHNPNSFSSFSNINSSQVLIPPVSIAPDFVHSSTAAQRNAPGTSNVQNVLQYHQYHQNNIIQNHIVIQSHQGVLSQPQYVPVQQIQQEVERQYIRHPTEINLSQQNIRQGYYISQQQLQSQSQSFPRATPRRRNSSNQTSIQSSVRTSAVMLSSNGGNTNSFVAPTPAMVTQWTLSSNAEVSGKQLSPQATSRRRNSTNQPSHRSSVQESAVFGSLNEGNTNSGASVTPPMVTQWSSAPYAEVSVQQSLPQATPRRRNSTNQPSVVCSVQKPSVQVSSNGRNTNAVVAITPSVVTQQSLPSNEEVTEKRIEAPVGTSAIRDNPVRNTKSADSPPVSLLQLILHDESFSYDPQRRHSSQVDFCDELASSRHNVKNRSNGGSLSEMNTTSFHVDKVFSSTDSEGNPISFHVRTKPISNSNISTTPVSLEGSSGPPANHSKCQAVPPHKFTETARSSIVPIGSTPNPVNFNVPPDTVKNGNRKQRVKYTQRRCPTIEKSSMSCTSHESTVPELQAVAETPNNSDDSLSDLQIDLDGETDACSSSNEIVGKSCTVSCATNPESSRISENPEILTILQAIPLESFNKDTVIDYVKKQLGVKKVNNENNVHNSLVSASASKPAQQETSNDSSVPEILEAELDSSPSKSHEAATFGTVRDSNKLEEMLTEGTATNKKVAKHILPASILKPASAIRKQDSSISNSLNKGPLKPLRENKETTSDTAYNNKQNVFKHSKPEEVQQYMVINDPENICKLVIASKTLNSSSRNKLTESSAGSDTETSSTIGEQNNSERGVWNSLDSHLQQKPVAEIEQALIEIYLERKGCTASDRTLDRETLKNKSVAYYKKHSINESLCKLLNQHLNAGQRRAPEVEEPRKRKSNTVEGDAIKKALIQGVKPQSQMNDSQSSSTSSSQLTPPPTPTDKCSWDNCNVVIMGENYPCDGCSKVVYCSEYCKMKHFSETHCNECDRDVF